jgi:hypothetical protein
MIAALEKIDGMPSLEFKRLYLCSRVNIIELLENEYIDDFLTYDNGIETDVDDPFLLSYIYAN